jgi:CRISPR/Cas system CMR subunit Cmr4 (Cas7 group RAMP superfamily)
MTRRIALARVTIETRSPLSIGSGATDHAADIVLVRDANDLPALPGAALAGVMRSVYAARHGRDSAEAEFGIDPALPRTGPVPDLRPSRVAVSWGHVCDTKGLPRDGLIFEAVTDPLLKELMASQPLQRDHVRIGPLGTAEDGGKFDRGAVPAGVSFRFHIERPLDDDEDVEVVDRLVATLADPRLRLGGATRRGYGEIRPAAVRVAIADLATRSGLDELKAFRSSLASDLPASFQIRSVPEGEAGLSCELVLQPCDFWRVGGGEDASSPQRGDNAPDGTPYRERRFENGKAKLALTVPASGIKGALRHRTAFHFRRLTGNFAKPNDKSSVQEPVEIAELFGAANGVSEARAGRLVLSDGIVEGPEATKIVQHNSIDRYTGGTRDQILFSEEVLFRQNIRLRITILDDPTPTAAAVPETVRQAFGLALSDLLQGRLAIGAGSAKGYGYCTGNLGDPRFEAWLGRCEP